MKREKMPSPEPIFPANKSVEELLLSTHEEIAEYASKAGISVEKFNLLLANAAQKKQESADARRALADKVPPGIDERADAIRAEIFASIDKLDFFRLNVVPGDVEALSDKAFSFLNLVEYERDTQKQRSLSSSAEAYFMESQKAWAGIRASALMREGLSQQAALAQVADEMQRRAKTDNVSERARAMREVAYMVSSRAFNTDMYEALESMKQSFASGSPDEESKSLMRRLVLAARGAYLKSGADTAMLKKYDVENFSPLIAEFTRAYKRAAAFKLGENNGALGSIEQFDIGLPNSYNSQGSPRSRPRRSSIPEERY